MKVPSIPIGPRIALYDHHKNLRIACQEAAYQLLESKCHTCGSTDCLRHRFINPNHPLVNRYRTNPTTLFRRIFREPGLRAELRLLCRECRLSTRVPNSSTPNPANPGQ